MPLVGSPHHRLSNTSPPHRDLACGGASTHGSSLRSSKTPQRQPPRNGSARRRWSLHQVATKAAVEARSRRAVASTARDRGGGTIAEDVRVEATRQRIS